MTAGGSVAALPIFANPHRDANSRRDGYPLARLPRVDAALLRMDEMPRRMDGAARHMDGAQRCVDGAQRCVDGAARRMDAARRRMDAASRRVDEKSQKLADLRKSLAAPPDATASATVAARRPGREMVREMLVRESVLAPRLRESLPARARGMGIPPECVRDRNHARAIFEELRLGAYPTTLRAPFLQWCEVHAPVVTINAAQIGLTTGRATEDLRLQQSRFA